MPDYFLAQAGIRSATDFAGAPGYSGSHDKTIDLVQSGSYEAGVLNVQVWQDRLDAGTVDLDRGAGGLHHPDLPRLPLDRRPRGGRAARRRASPTG